MTLTTILFDWDGTLLDSAERGYHAFEAMLAEFGIAFDRPTFERCYAPNWYAMYEELGLHADHWPRADERWVHHYGDECPALVPGAAATLAALARAGYVLGIVSSGNRERVHRELEALGVRRFFHTVVAAEDVVRKKPDPEGLHLAMRACGASGEQCLYVGDAPEDVHMGRAAGMLTAGVRSAYPTLDALLEAEPDLWLETIVEVGEWFGVVA